MLREKGLRRGTRRVLTGGEENSFVFPCLVFFERRWCCLKAVRVLSDRPID